LFGTGSPASECLGRKAGTFNPKLLTGSATGGTIPGVAHVIPAHTESSLALGSNLLQDIGITHDDVEALVADMRRDHYALLAPGTGKG
jgi:hypothetical protein